MPECYKLKEAAAALKITEKTLYRLHRDGKISFVKIGNRNRVSDAELERFMQAESTRRETAGA